MSLKVSIILITLAIFASSHPYEEEIIPFQKTLSTRVLLDGESCKRVECNLGNFITDAMVDYNALQYTGEVGWTDAAIALIDGESIKSSIERGQTLTSEHFDRILEGTKIVAIELTGQQLKDALEKSVANYDIDGFKNYNEFLQNSGLFVEYDLTKPTGQRITSLQITCADCDSPIIFDINLTRKYRVLMPEALAKGKHGYTVFEGKIVKELTVSDKEMFVAYLSKKSPIYPAVEWRITFDPEVMDEPKADAAVSVKTSFALIFASIFLSIISNRKF